MLINVEEPLEVRQANEKYLLNKKHELEKQIKNLKNYVKSISIINILKIKLDNPLYFSFGKYKGRIVQDILEKDYDYCVWFRDNVRGRDFETLQIIDYFVKKINDSNYWLGNPRIELDNLVKEYNIKLSDVEKQSILDEFSYTKRKSNNSSDFDCGYMTPWEESMYEIYDYGDLC